MNGSDLAALRDAEGVARKDLFDKARFKDFGDTAHDGGFSDLTNRYRAAVEARVRAEVAES